MKPVPLIMADSPSPAFPLVVKAVHHPVVDGVASRDGAVIGIFAVPIALGRPGPGPIGIVHLL